MFPWYLAVAGAECYVVVQMEHLNSVFYFIVRCNQSRFGVFYPEPSLVSAVVRLALLLSLPPLDQAGGVVTGKADVTAAGGGADSSPDASEKERLGAERQLHPARQ